MPAISLIIVNGFKKEFNEKPKQVLNTKDHEFGFRIWS